MVTPSNSELLASIAHLMSHGTGSPTWQWQHWALATPFVFSGHMIKTYRNNAQPKDPWRDK